MTRVREHGLRPEDPQSCPRPRSASASKAAAQILELGQLLERKPRQLSGGQRQRVGHGPRHRARSRKVFLFDEPLSNLDAKLRVAMRLEILQAAPPTWAPPACSSPHDQVEAMTLAHRMVVMNQGVPEQIGTPMEVFERPASTLRGRLHRLAADEPHPRAGLDRRRRLQTADGVDAGDPARRGAVAGARPPRGRWACAPSSGRCC